MRKLISILLITSNICYADGGISDNLKNQLANKASGTVSVTHLNKNDPAPYDGYLFTPQMEQKARQSDMDATFYKDQNLQLNTIIQNQNDAISKQDQRISLRDQQIDELEKQKKSDDFLPKVAYFVGGAIVTALIAKGIYFTR